MSCCFVVVVAAATATATAAVAAAAAVAVAAVAVGPGGGAVAEAVANGQQTLILGAICDSRYHPGTNGKKREDEGGIRRQGKGDDMAAEVGSPGEDGGDRTTEDDMNSLGTDWDKGRPWAGRTEQDVGTEWLRRLDCRKRRSRTWSDRERAARGEGNVIPGAGGRSSLGWVTRRLNIM